MAVRIVSRREWGARKPKRPLSAAPGMTGVTFHWNGPRLGVPATCEGCAARVRGIQAFHMDGNGWTDIGYNFLICPHGTIFEGRGYRTINAAQGTNAGNRGSHGVMFLAGEGDPFPEASKVAAVDLANHIGGTRKVHNDWTNTTCPGPERTRWVRDGMPVKSATPTPIPATKGKKMFRYTGPDGGWYLTDGLHRSPHGLAPEHSQALDIAGTAPHKPEIQGEQMLALHINTKPVWP